jgi:ferredoxin--NADP+ reductase
MELVGTDATPLRVAIIGSGPAAFYAADRLLKQAGLKVEIDMFERFPTPYGLVRTGVAPDHQKIKSVTKTFAEIASSPRFRFYGLVEFGKDIVVSDLREHYHQILYATGAQADKRIGIPGEELKGIHAANEFIGWYNGHPDYRDCQFDLFQERVAIVGMGNVAVDVARILCLTPDELAVTDIASHALGALSQSRIKEVYLLGRRGPAQAAFTNPEIKELGNLADADIFVLPEEAQLDDSSRAALDASHDRVTRQKVEILQGYASRKPAGGTRQLSIRFMVSPVDFLGNTAGQVVAMRLVKNALYETEAGTLRPKATDRVEELPTDLVFRSVGYRGTPLPEVPFNERWGVILNEKGRVVGPESQQPVVGEYCSGWIKRGPTGVIGTNKLDSVETVNCMLVDLAHGSILRPSEPAVTKAEHLVRKRQPNYFSFADWLRLDAMEVKNGRAQGRPREKFTRVEDMLAALGR